jgi:hypothetical protein
VRVDGDAVHRHNHLLQQLAQLRAPHVPQHLLHCENVKSIRQKEITSSTLRLQLLAYVF